MTFAGLNHGRSANGECFNHVINLGTASLKKIREIAEIRDAGPDRLPPNNCPLGLPDHPACHIHDTTGLVFESLSPPGILALKTNNLDTKLHGPEPEANRRDWTGEALHGVKPASLDD